MSEKILFVDDEPNILEGIRRQLRKRYSVLTAEGAQEGLAILASEAPLAVVVSDMRMPGMNGAEFLMRVRAADPDAVRMILSGQAELESTIAAVNEGHIFRFLTKPCGEENLTSTLEAALEQYRLVIAERELLEDTLSGIVKLLTEVIALVNPEAFSRAARIQRYTEGIAENLGSPYTWEIRLAAMLSQLGCLAVPAEVIERALTEQPMSDEERELYQGHAQVAAELLGRIPRLETVADIVGGHMRAADASGVGDAVRGWRTEIRGAEVLRAASEFDRLLSVGKSRGEALASLRESAGLPDEILQAVMKLRIEQGQEKVLTLGATDLRTGMVIDESLLDDTGVLLVASGQEVTEAMLLRLRSYASRGIVQEPFRVRVPPSSGDEAA